MADQSSSLPVRTEQDGDVVIRVGDGLVPSQQLTVNPDGSVNITDNSGSITVDSTDFDIRDLDSATDSVEVLQATHDSLNANVTIQVNDVDVSDANPVPVSDAGGSLTVDATDLDIRDLAFATDKVDVTGSDVTATVTATDLDIRDLSSDQDNVEIRRADGVALSINNDGSLNVVPQEDPGTEIVNYNTAATVAAGATSNHEHLFTNSAKLYQVHATASGKMKIEVQVETGAATGTFNTIIVGFNSTAAPNIELTLNKYALVPAGARVRVIRTNRDLSAQDVYSTIVAIEGN